MRGKINYEAGPFVFGFDVENELVPVRKIRLTLVSTELNRGSSSDFGRGGNIGSKWENLKVIKIHEV